MKWTTTVITGILFFAGCSSVPTEDIKLDWQTNPKVNVGGYRSYAWLATATAIYNPQEKWTPPAHWAPPAFDVDAELKYLIDRELRNRGFTENSNNPDMFVAFSIGINLEALGFKKEPDTETWKYENVPSGSLLIVFRDSESGSLVWTGLATSEIQEHPDMVAVNAYIFDHPG